jgi:hypothetical protein
MSNGLEEKCAFLPNNLSNYIRLRNATHSHVSVSYPIMGKDLHTRDYAMKLITYIPIAHPVALSHLNLH